MTQVYFDPIIQKYIDLIKSKTNVFKAFYQGEPTRIPVSMMPCLCISKQETRAGHISNVEDEHGIAMSFIVVVDIRKDLSTTANDNPIVEGVSQLYDIIEGRESNYELKDTSLLDILRTNQLVDASGNLRTDLSQPTRVVYGETFQNRDPEEWRIEARLEVIAQFIQLR